ncbi:hypothetical protein IQ07DRAFT_91199 [Pyrenochaeta sp. DS3sAY3a]|nr:hypothetical protein IQ07DRAFT_91199 [Pyrenochaeta sp. DS3sAY3a]
MSMILWFPVNFSVPTLLPFSYYIFSSSQLIRQFASINCDSLSSIPVRKGLRFVFL